MTFSLIEANHVTGDEPFERVEYGSCCIDMIMNAMKTLKDEFYCVFVFDGTMFPIKQLELERCTNKCVGAKETLTIMIRIF